MTTTQNLDLIDYRRWDASPVEDEDKLVCCVEGGRATIPQLSRQHRHRGRPLRNGLCNEGNSDPCAGCSQGPRLAHLIAAIHTLATVPQPGEMQPTTYRIKWGTSFEWPLRKQHTRRDQAGARSGPYSYLRIPPSSPARSSSLRGLDSGVSSFLCALDSAHS